MEDTTRRLDDTGGPGARLSLMGVRWLLPGGRVLHSWLDADRITLGRGERESVRLDAPGLSRSHAEIVRDGDVYLLRDCGSLNGTYVNRQQIDQIALSRGDVLRLGDVLGIVVRIAVRTPADLAPIHAPLSIGGSMFGLGLAELLASMRRCAPTSLPVVLEGETGTGKECVARAFHELSVESGRTGPFHAVNCAAIPAPLAETELFGHKRGAFTGAEQANVGHFRAAQHGTLFLDELADLPAPVQAKLLRVLQDGEVTPLGETRSVSVDVRVIAAVQEPVASLVASRRLREDLAMRLSGLVLRLPPLRERREDIAELFLAFLNKHSGGRAPEVAPRALEDITTYAWPGNVRELELVARQVLALHGHETLLRRDMLPERLQCTSSSLPAPSTAPNRFRAAAVAQNGRSPELLRLTAELERNGGNVKRAAAAVGISRQRAYRLLAQRSSGDQRASTQPPAADDADSGESV